MVKLAPVFSYHRNMPVQHESWEDCHDASEGRVEMSTSLGCAQHFQRSKVQLIPSNHILGILVAFDLQKSCFEICCSGWSHP